MATTLLRILFPLLLLTLNPKRSGGQYMEEWCVVDEQTPEEELQKALDWACQKGGADCSKIQVGQPCYLPNTLKDHAAFAFNDYYQKFKHKGGSCYFNAAAMVTALNPSHDSCKFDYVP
ncbi:PLASMODESMATA CALLOSE-BINDING PROTEIN 5 [Morus notabilis]|nr:PLASMODESMATA CALLOSE-BINDING PROTEIN 5 [Morus notabilis]